MNEGSGWLPQSAHGEPVSKRKAWVEVRNGAGQRFGSVGVDKAMLVDGEAHRNIEVEIASQDAGEHRHRLFGAVFLVAGEKDDLGFGRVVLGEQRGRGNGGGEEQGEEFRHDFQWTQLSGLTR